MCCLSNSDSQHRDCPRYTAASIFTTVLPLFVLFKASSHAMTCQMHRCGPTWSMTQELLMDAVNNVAKCSEYLLQTCSFQNISSILWAYTKLSSLTCPSTCALPCRQGRPI